jgi:hypothetical protein
VGGRPDHRTVPRGRIQGNQNGGLRAREGRRRSRRGRRRRRRGGPATATAAATGERRDHDGRKPESDDSGTSASIGGEELGSHFPCLSAHMGQRYRFSNNRILPRLPMQRAHYLSKALFTQ